MVSDFRPFFDDASPGAGRSPALSHVDGADAGGYTFESGTVIKGTVQRDLNANRYALVFGDARVVIRSTVPLPVDGTATFLVRSTTDNGTRAELELTGLTTATGQSTPITGTSPAPDVSAAAPSSFSPSTLEMRVPLTTPLLSVDIASGAQPPLHVPVFPEGVPSNPIPPENTLAEIMLKAGEISLHAGTDGRVTAVFPGGVSAPVSSAWLHAATDAARPMTHTPADDMLPQLAHTLRALPSNQTIVLSDIQTALRQSISLETTLPTPDGAARTVQLRGSIHPENLDRMLPPQSPQEAVVVASTPGTLRLAVQEGQVTVSVPPWFSLHPGATVNLTASVPELAIRGLIQLELPPQIPVRSDQVQTGPLDGVAAAALRDHGLTVTQGDITNLVQAAIVLQPENPAPLIQLGARLLARGLPVSAEWIAAMNPETPQPSLPTLLSSVSSALEAMVTGPMVQEAKVLLSEAQALLAKVSVPLGDPAAAEGIRHYARSLAADAIPQAISLVESAVGEALRALPPAQAFDTLTALLGPPSPEMAAQLSDAGKHTTLRELLGEAAHLWRDMPALPPQTRAALDTLLDLPRDTTFAEKAEATLARLPAQERQSLASFLMREESAFLASRPEIEQLANLRDALAQASERSIISKADNLSNLRQEPVFLVAQIPLRLDGRDEEASLRFFSRREPRRPGSASTWNNRVLLDLHTTRMGPVLGDLRFSAGRLDVQLGASDEEATQHLRSGQGDLQAALIEAGYHALVTFAPITQAPRLPHPPVDPEAEPPAHEPSDGHVNITA